MAQIAGKYDLESDEQRVAYSEEICGLLATLPSEVERDIYAARAAELVSVPVDSLRNDVSRLLQQKNRKDAKKQLRRILNPVAEMQPQSRKMRIENTRSAVSELGVIRLLILDDGIFSNDFPLSENDFSFPLYGKVFSLLWKEHCEGRRPKIANISNQLDQEEMNYLTSALQSDSKFKLNREAMLADYIRIIQAEAAKRSGGETDPLLAAAEKHKDKKGEKRNV